jgi:hypothetical protein
MRTLLVLARISNLPTVWSNCLAATLLAGGTSVERLTILCLGATLLYTGGMFLNDAVDQKFDRRYRPERPIVAGQITARTVWWLSSTFLIAGWAILLCLGMAPGLLASGLLAAIVLYDVVHKSTVLAPLLMAACRFLLYLVAAAVANPAQFRPVWSPAAALAAYIVGLSYLARGESTGGILSRWPLSLLFAPALVAIAGTRLGSGLVAGVAVIVQVGWTVWCVWPVKAPRRLIVPRGVAGLLAGIVWVDWVAAAGSAPPLVFIALFCCAVLSQRIAPAT